MFSELELIPKSNGKKKKEKSFDSLSHRIRLIDIKDDISHLISLSGQLYTFKEKMTFKPIKKALKFCVFGKMKE